MRARQRGRFREQGVALIDLIVVIVIVSILAAYVAMRTSSPGDNTIKFQAERLARDLRHMQLITATFGKPLVMDATSAGYSVSCVTAGTAPCDASPIIDPATGDQFAVALRHNVTLAVSGAGARFDMQGRPLTSALAVATTATTYTLTASDGSVAVAVAPVTGFVSVTP